MAKFPEAVARLFGNVFICRKCNTKIRTQISKVLHKSIACRKCGCRSFRPVRRK